MSEKTCERDSCAVADRTYYRHGRTTSSAPFTYGSTAQVLPEQPITLCSRHALEAFRVAFTALPGDDA